jgi:hypothetical protein
MKGIVKERTAKFKKLVPSPICLEGFSSCISVLPLKSSTHHPSLAALHDRDKIKDLFVQPFP